MNERIELLRERLYAAIDIGSSYEILKVSQALDIEIVNFMTESIAFDETADEIEKQLERKGA